MSKWPPHFTIGHTSGPQGDDRVQRAEGHTPRVVVHGDIQEAEGQAHASQQGAQATHGDEDGKLLAVGPTVQNYWEPQLTPQGT